MKHISYLGKLNDGTLVRYSSRGTFLKGITFPDEGQSESYEWNLVGKVMGASNDKDIKIMKLMCIGFKFISVTGERLTVVRTQQNMDNWSFIATDGNSSWLYNHAGQCKQTPMMNVAKVIEDIRDDIEYTAGGYDVTIRGENSNIIYGDINVDGKIIPMAWYPDTGSCVGKIEEFRLKRKEFRVTNSGIYKSSDGRNVYVGKPYMIAGKPYWPGNRACYTGETNAMNTRIYCEDGVEYMHHNDPRLVKKVKSY